MLTVHRLLSLFVGAWLAGCSHAPTADPASTLRILSEQARRWDEAIVAKDRSAILANMADDFRQIDGAGNVETKVDFVEGLLDPELRIEPYTVEDFEVRQYGDTALLSGRTHMKGSIGGKPFSTHYRYIDIYLRRHGAWKIVSVQITPMPR